MDDYNLQQLNRWHEARERHREDLGEPLEDELEEVRRLRLRDRLDAGPPSAHSVEMLRECGFPFAVPPTDGEAWRAAACWIWARNIVRDPRGLSAEDILRCLHAILYRIVEREGAQA